MERIGRALEARLRDDHRLRLHAREAVALPRRNADGIPRHTAREDVLEDPGERDITAHVNFTALEEHGAACGLRRRSVSKRWRRLLLAAGEEDQFAAALAADDGAREELRRRMQLKTLLFGMGETFRVLMQRRGGRGKPATK